MLLLISFLIHQHMALLFVDPLHRANSAGLLVCLYWNLYWKNKDYAKGRDPIACGNEILGQIALFVCSVSHELVL